MRPRTFSMAVLALALIALAVWRGVCVMAGPDVDTDAYAHHMIARAILADPHDLAVHWVWLPLFHYAQVPLVALGGTMQDVRWANVALTAALPAFLFAYVRRTARPGEGGFSAGATALLAALLTALCPIGMQMGTTAQPEPLFGLLILGVAITLQDKRYFVAAALLGAAVLLRYEAWAVLVAVGAALAVESAWHARRSVGRAPRETHPARAWRAWTVVLGPATLVVAWAALRRPVDGQWFGFLRDTHQFASAAMHQTRVLDRGVVPLARDLFYYPVVVPRRVLGAPLLLVPFGVLRTVRQQGPRFVLVFLACLGFVSLTWVMRSTLGLDRHFVVVVPLYATFAAQGASALADGVAHVVGRLRPGRPPVAVGRAAAGVLAAGLLLGLVVQLDVWMGFWRTTIQRGWPGRVALGRYLRSLPTASTIFCDEATIEILSGLDRSRFDRHWVDDPHTWVLIERVAHDQGVTYVATWRRKLRGHENAGEVLFEADDEPGDAPDRMTGVAVMRVKSDTRGAAR